MSLRTKRAIAFLKGEPHHQTVGLKLIAQNNFELEYWELFDLLCTLRPSTATKLLEVLEESKPEYRSGFSTWLGKVFSCNISIENMLKGFMISAMKSYKESLCCSLKEAHGIVNMLRYRIKNVDFDLIEIEDAGDFFKCTYDNLQDTRVDRNLKFSEEEVAKAEFILALYINH